MSAFPIPIPFQTITRWTLLAALLLTVTPVAAQWLPDGLPVCDLEADQDQLAIAPDGAGGLLMVWTDRRAGILEKDIYAQRLDPAGVPQWTEDGLAVCAHGESADTPSICPDGSGGAWIVWEDGRESRSLIYAKHLAADGSTLWGGADGGPVVSDLTRYHHRPVCDADGSGGVIVGWDCYDGDYLVLAQHLDAAGTALWAADGVECGSYGNGEDLQVLARPEGGAYLVWKYSIAVVVQRLSSAGAVMWDPDGVEPVDATTSNRYPVAVLDGSGGLIVAWQGMHLINETYGIYAQRLDSGGNSLFFADPWPPAPVTLYTPGLMELDAGRPAICSDGAGGAVVAWDEYDSFNTEYGAIRGQRINDAGTKLWGSTPKQVSAGDENQNDVVLVSHGDQSVVVWTGLVGMTWYGQAQWLTSTGYRTWGDDYSDVALPTTWGVQAVAGLGTQTLLGWVPDVYPTDKDIYAHGISGTGALLQAELSVSEFSYGAAVYPVNTLVRPTITVINDGNLACGPFQVYFYRNSSIPPTTFHIPTATLEHEGLAAGESLTWQPPYGSSAIEDTWHSYVWVDRYDDVPESDETDNKVGPVDLQWVVMPDLAITGLEASLAEPRAGEPVTVTVTVTNQGSAASGPFDLDLYRYHSSVPAVGESGTFTHRIADLAPGASVVWTSDPFTYTGGTQYFEDIYAQVDTQEEVVEIFENNNLAGPLGLSWMNGIDLAVTAFTLSESTPELGAAVTASITVANLGFLTVEYCPVDFYQDRDTAPGAWPRGDQTAEIFDLAPGGTFEWTTAPFTWSDDLDTWTCWARVDPGFVLTDYDWDNNLAGPLTLEWSVPTQSGWPASVGGLLSSPVIAALRDGELRRVLATGDDGHCYAWDYAGNPLSGWPYDSGASLTSPPAVGDLDGDGVMEVVFGADNGVVICLDPDGNKVWTFQTTAAVDGACVLADFYDTGTLNVLVFCRDGNLYQLNPNGTPVAGWPIDLGETTVSSPAVADLDGDGDLEIVAITLLPKDAGSEVHAMDRYGVRLSPDWPVKITGLITASPALGNVLGDAGLEIVVGDWDGLLHVWQDDPTAPSLHLDLGAPIQASPALVNADTEDAVLDVAVATQFLVETPIPGHYESQLFLIRGDGTFYSGYPVLLHDGLRNTQANAGPVSWGVGKTEFRLAVGTWDGQCWVFNARGDRFSGLTMPTSGHLGASLAVGELDADAHLEVVVTGGDEITCYDLLADSYSPEAMVWPLWGHDARRTRAAGTDAPSPVDTEIPVPPQRHARLDPAYPNPFNPQVTIAFGLAESDNVELSIYDAAGRRVRTLLSGGLEAGSYRLPWDGCDDAGRSTASGVYLVRLKSPRGVDVQRITLVR